MHIIDFCIFELNLSTQQYEAVSLLHIRSFKFSWKLYYPKVLKDIEIAQSEIKSISLIGSSEKLKWEQNPQSLKVIFPKEKSCDFAYELKVERY